MTTKNMPTKSRMDEFWDKAEEGIRSDNPDTRFYTSQIVRLKQAKDRQRRQLDNAKDQHDFMRACYELDETVEVLREEAKQHERAK